MSCDDICSKKNKFRKSYGSKGEVAKISLNIVQDERNLIYTVTNTGTLTLCNDVIICSKLYRTKIIIENRILLEGDSVTVTKSFNDIKNPQVNETEIARAYTKLKDNLYLASDSVKFAFENGSSNLNRVNVINNDGISDATLGGIFIASRTIFNVLGDGYNIYCTMVNSFNSSSDATNVRFTIGYSGVIDQNVIARANTPSKFEISKDNLGVHGYIPLWKRNETYTFLLVLPTTVTYPRPFVIPFAFKLTSDNKFSRYSNYIYMKIGDVAL